MRTFSPLFRSIRRAVLYPTRCTSSKQARIAQIDAEKGVSPFLVDTFQRQHNYLRISLTERCNLRCT